MKTTFEEIIKEKKPSLVLFIHAGEQKDPEITELFEKIKEKYEGKVNFLRVDSSYDHIVNREHNLTTYPTYVLFKEGEELMRESGKKTVAELSDMIDRAF